MFFGVFFLCLHMSQLARVGAATRTSECFSPRQWSGSCPSCTFLGLWKIIAVVYERERPWRNTSSRPQLLKFLLVSELRCRHRNGVCLIDTVGLWFLSAAWHHSDVLFTLKLLSVQKWSVRVLQRRCSLNTSKFLSSSAILSHNGLHLYSNHCVLKEAHCLPASHHVTYMQRDLAVLLFYFVWGTVELLMITRLKAHVFGPGSVLKWRLSCADSAFSCASYLPSSKVIDDCVYYGV